VPPAQQQYPHGDDAQTRHVLGGSEGTGQSSPISVATPPASIFGGDKGIHRTE